MNQETNSISVDDAVAEGWAYRRPASRNKARILGAIAPCERAREWGVVSTQAPLSREALRQAIMAAIELAPAGFATALSHDHYLTIAGGVQNCIGDEQAALCAAGWAYLHICPNRPLPMLAPETEAESFQVLASLNGQTVGVTSIADLEAILADVVRAGHRPRCVVHHMLGFAPELVTKLIQASGEKQPIV